jgi:hypothetical protein
MRKLRAQRPPCGRCRLAVSGRNRFGYCSICWRYARCPVCNRHFRNKPSSSWCDECMFGMDRWLAVWDTFPLHRPNAAVRSHNIKIYRSKAAHGLDLFEAHPDYPDPIFRS